MILTRLGNKRRIASSILKHLPPPDDIRIWIEPFFGAGGMFFQKPKSRYNILNDLDSEVYNLFTVVSDQHEALGREWMKTPFHEDLWKYWQVNIPADPVTRAVRFLQLSNMSYMGKGKTMRFNSKNAQRLLMERLEVTGELLFGCEFMNADFRQIFPRVSMTASDKQNAFCYCDPPYLDTSNNYSAGFKKEDSNDLFDVLEGSGVRWAMSEFDHPFIIDQVMSRGLNMTVIGERRNLKNRRTEILVTNY